MIGTMYMSLKYYTFSTSRNAEIKIRYTIHIEKTYILKIKTTVKAGLTYEKGSGKEGYVYKNILSKVCLPVSFLKKKVPFLFFTIGM